MDPLSLAASVAVLVSFAASTLRVMTSVSVATPLNEPNLKAASARLYSEKTQLQLWEDHVRRVIGWENLKRAVSESEAGLLTHLFKDAQTLLEDAHKRFAEVDLEIKRGKPLQTAWAMLKWKTSESRADINDMLNAVHAINEALDKLVPAPPRYVGFNSSINQMPSGPAGDASTIDASPLDTTCRHSDDLVGNHAERETIEALHRAAAKGLRAIWTMREGNAVFKDCVRDLERWGEILVGPLALDDILKKRSDADVVRRAIITTFVDVLLLEDAIFDVQTKVNGPSDVEQIRMQTISVLGEDGIYPILEGRLSSVAKSADLTTTTQSAHAKLTEMINNLYELLSVILSLRRQEILLEEMTKRQPRVAADPTDAMLQTAIDEGKILLDNAKRSASGDGITRDLQAIVMKECALLGEYRKTNISKLNPEERAVAEASIRQFRNFVASKNSGAVPAEGSSKGKELAGTGEKDVQALIEALQGLHFELPRVEDDVGS